ncbi:uncharacterized protein FOMMEDRAFT_158230 [Fomitiporia mediterranea MF3/22]|uniref:uncharacterized protein n=1 Tax=Fomitiporia mediterranea (strain MF3/22) TaxID=694068 RepID=UPI0004408E8C|nr:uncharacterized protein FOMMEDRAFT_158230 [Fomitiporia mediterranea MF3/22]EJD01094.1 hypothetical protein FOMMEDRAFT_158230 [Fomitiporia mediterranea MF3/22]
MDKTTTISGYYRYTHILFAYPGTIQDPGEASAFKSFVHYTALGDPAHPLRVNNEKGLELYIGTLREGKTRLMFSSSQFEYIRYLLHATELTKELLPLPSSKYLLTESMLTNISTVYLKSPIEMKKAYQVVEKNGRKLKCDMKLSSFRHTFDKVRDIYASKKGTWMAIDIEAWTVLSSAITELGWSFQRWNDDQEMQGQGHFIIKKNKNLRNGQHVADAQDKFAFGSSVELETTEFKSKVDSLFTDLQSSGPLFLVFHDAHGDIRFLNNSEYFPEGLIDNFMFSLPSGIPDEGTFVIDTTELFSALEGDARMKRSLGDMCRLLNIETLHLHNAGNDAHYTLLALKTMASGNQVDAQREERWPSRTLTSTVEGSSLKVVYAPEDEDSDYSEPGNV